mmetsp:Transcript_15241/g.29967  ORF Transcript_15241/g.29967 Transcript_15241/m.29967 type:complete len:228 (-) Transcript_15241:510-1193(-)
MEPPEIICGKNNTCCLHIEEKNFYKTVLWVAMRVLSARVEEKHDKEKEQKRDREVKRVLKFTFKTSISFLRVAWITFSTKQSTPVGDTLHVYVTTLAQTHWASRYFNGGQRIISVDKKVLLCLRVFARKALDARQWALGTVTYLSFRIKANIRACTANVTLLRTRVSFLCQRTAAAIRAAFYGVKCVWGAKFAFRLAFLISILPFITRETLYSPFEVHISPEGALRT